jgi:amino acid permease
MNYLVISALICFVIAISLTVSIPGSKQKNLENDKEIYDIKTMEIFSYIFYAIGGILILPEIISYFKK